MRLAEAVRPEEKYSNVLLPRAFKYDSKLRGNDSEKHFIQIIDRWRKNAKDNP